VVQGKAERQSCSIFIFFVFPLNLWTLALNTYVNMYSNKKQAKTNLKYTPEFTNYALMQLQICILYINMLMSTHNFTQTLIP